MLALLVGLLVLRRRRQRPLRLLRVLLLRQLARRPLQPLRYLVFSTFCEEKWCFFPFFRCLSLVFCSFLVLLERRVQERRLRGVLLELRRRGRLQGRLRGSWYLFRLSLFCEKNCFLCVFL